MAHDELAEALRARATADEDYCATLGDLDPDQWDDIDATRLTVSHQVDGRVLRIEGTPDAIARAIRDWIAAT